MRKLRNPFRNDNNGMLEAEMLLHEALEREKSSLKLIGHLFNIGASCPQYTAGYVVRVLVGQCISKLSTCALEFAMVISERIQFLYYKASLLPGFDACSPTATLVPILKCAHVNPRRIETVTKLASRLIASHPTLFTQTHLRSVRNHLLESTREPQAGGDGGDGEWVPLCDPRVVECVPSPLQIQVEVLIRLDWLPYDAHHLRRVINPKVLGLDAALVLHYLHRFAIMADDDEKACVSAELIYISMERCYGPSVWIALARVLLGRGVSVACANFKKLTSILVNSPRPLNEHEAAFLLWAHLNEVPMPVDIKGIVFRCAPGVSVSLFDCLRRNGTYSSPLDVLWEMGKATDPLLLEYLLWETDLRPTQLFARMIAKGCTNSHPIFLRHIVWLYNLRELVRDKKSGRLFVGPRVSPPLLLPITATNTIVEFAWQGSMLNLQVDLAGMLTGRH
jgi:hypothetical protein